MVMPAKSEKNALLVIAVVHLAVVIIHAYTHVVAAVHNTLWQLVFIFLVVFFAPLAAVYIAWKIGSVPDFAL
jgi:hypothetical protein